MMNSLFVSVFTASLVGSVHCAGMCGGLVPLYAGIDPHQSRSLRHVAYSVGRLLAYATLGVIAGSLGALIEIAGNLAGWQRAASWIAGVLIVLWGAYTLFTSMNWMHARIGVPGALRRALTRGMSMVSRIAPLPRALVVGLLSALLPCGWLWAFVVVAAGTSSAWRGALCMAVFWIGTLPMMLSVGVLVGAMAGPLRRRLPVATALLMIAIGLMTVVRRAPMPMELPGTEAGVPTSPSCHGHR